MPPGVWSFGHNLHQRKEKSVKAHTERRKDSCFQGSVRIIHIAYTWDFPNKDIRSFNTMKSDCEIRTALREYYHDKR